MLTLLVFFTVVLCKYKGAVVLLAGMHKLSNEDYLLFEKVECEK